MKIKPLTRPDSDEIVAYEFYCAGCRHAHVFYTKSIDGQPVWTFNGDVNNPTFSPSLLNTWTIPATNEEKKRCHLFLNSGKVQFLSDCSHSLAGKTVDLEDIKE